MRHWIALLLEWLARLFPRLARRLPTSHRSRPDIEREITVAVEPDAPPAPTPQPEPAGPDGSASAEPPRPALEPVRFTVYHPQELIPEQWTKLIAYVHLPGARSAVEEDSQRVLAGEASVHGARERDAIVPIAREAVVRIVPELPGCRFNPPETSVMWLEDWHSAVFRVQAHPSAPGFAVGQAVNGRVAFYVESVLVGEVPIWGLISERPELAPGALRPTDPADVYEKIFVSYSHQDGEVVEALGRAYRVLGMQFLRDVDELRSGEEWNPRLLELIEAADVFQLYWSEAASRSPYVAQEWRHAVAQQRAGFIRPLYWSKPMPDPPPELEPIHFAFLAGVGPG